MDIDVGINKGIIRVVLSLTLVGNLEGDRDRLVRGRVRLGGV